MICKAISTKRAERTFMMHRTISKTLKCRCWHIGFRHYRSLVLTSTMRERGVHMRMCRVEIVLLLQSRVRSGSQTAPARVRNSPPSKGSKLLANTEIVFRPECHMVLRAHHLAPRFRVCCRSKARKKPTVCQCSEVL